MSNLTSKEEFNNKGISDDIQCKDCEFKIGDDEYSNDYRKGSCQIYPYPELKPQSVMMNNGKCESYRKEK